LGTALLLSFAGSQMMVPCSRYGPVDSKATVEGATVIVVAKAGAYVRRPEVQRRPDGEGVVRFTVREVLKGGGVPSELQIHGYLDDRDDFNDHPPPYHFVRPGGRAGSCFAGNYRRGATYLLLLQNRDGEWTVKWDPLAPVNEQLHSSQDPWVGWVRDQLTHVGAAK